VGHTGFFVPEDWVRGERAHPVVARFVRRNADQSLSVGQAPRVSSRSNFPGTCARRLVARDGTLSRVPAVAPRLHVRPAPHFVESRRFTDADGAVVSASVRRPLPRPTPASDRELVLV
jgi:hypothetical protein